MQSDSGKLFVGGISWDTNEERLKDYFSAFGEVVEVVIMKDRATGRARGFGFIVFADPAVAERVIQEKHTIDGRMVEAKKAIPREDQNIMSRTSGILQGSSAPSRTKKMFVGGLASTVTESDFKNYFDQFGMITDVVVMCDHNTQRPRGFGFITFDSEEAVDRVLLKTFHELNGKMVEVKRAVPKELSPGSSRSPLSYNYGLNRVSNILSGYAQGYIPTLDGNYGVRMNGQFSPISASRSGFPPFEPGLNAGFGGNVNFNSNLSYGRGLNPYYINNDLGSHVGYDGSNGANSSFFSSGSRNLWGPRGTNSTSSDAQIGFGSIGGSTFANAGVNWGSSASSAQNNFNGGRVSGYGRPELSYEFGGGEYERNLDSSYASSNGGFDGAFGDFYNGGSAHADPTWPSLSSEREGIGPFGYGLGNASSDVSVRNPPGYVGGYSVNTRQSNRGIDR